MSQEQMIEEYSVQKAVLRGHLEEKHDTSTYQKRDLLWSKAWNLGRSGGRQGVETWYSELVELLP